MRLAAVLEDAQSGRSMDVLTAAPCVQVYTVNHLDGTTVLQDGKVFARHGAVCFESQQLPDAPNNAAFGDVVLRPSERYWSPRCIGLNRRHALKERLLTKTAQIGSRQDSVPMTASQIV